MAATVIEALRRFLPPFLRARPPLDEAKRRAIWAITHCREEAMGGHLLGCEEGCTRQFRYHSCNHRSCPQCGKQATAEWVARELRKRVGAPYFMVTFTLPQELRGLFLGAAAKPMYQHFFAAASCALSDTLANPRWLGARTCGFTLVLHTWNQRLHFHPHLHAIVPGAGIDADGNVVTVKNANFLVPQKVLRSVFRARLRDLVGELTLSKKHPLPAIDPAVWQKDWGVHLQPFGSGSNIIKYLGRYVCRTAIGDSRILSSNDTHVTFRWKDRANGDAPRAEAIPGEEFVERYLRHVLPRGLRAIRYYGFCHPAAKAKRERVAFHTGVALFAGALALESAPPKASAACACPRCGQPLKPLLRLPPGWSRGRAPPPVERKPACA